MPLDSTDTSSKAGEGKFKNGPNSGNGAEVKLCTSDKAGSSWVYLIIHHTKVNVVVKKIEEKFNVFIHKTIVYRRENKRVVEKEKVTIPGLVFVQGESGSVQHFLNQNYFGLYLVKDYTTRRPAIIPDSIMQPFIQLSRFAPNRIRFMPHAFGYYASGHTLVKVTSGLLAGFEGYLVRISRDRCLVTSMGGMTVAIHGVCKDTVENAAEYARQRRLQQGNIGLSDSGVDSYHADIENCFFRPYNELDLLVIAQSLDQWVMKSGYLLLAGNYREAADILCFMLERVGHYLAPIYGNHHIGNFEDIVFLVQKIDRLLSSMSSNSDIPSDLREYVLSEQRSLAIRYPFLSFDKDSLNL